MKKIYLFLMIALFAITPLTVLTISPVQAHDDTEILYLTDSAFKGDSKTYLYQVDLNDVSGNADLTLLEEFPFEQVDAMAASADGSIIYLIDKVTSKIGTYDVNADSFSDTGIVINDGGVTVPQIVLAAFSPQGDLFIASDSTDKVYTVDIASGVASSRGKVAVGASNLDISGADLAFLTDGTMYIWVNNGSLTGLFEVADPYAVSLTGTQIGGGQDTFFTGLAVRENGAGDLVGSETKNLDSIVVVSKSDASFIKTYPMYYEGSPYAYEFGDMTAGPIISPLIISKTVDTAFDRTWEWSIDKTADVTELELNKNQSYNINYDVTLSAEAVDSDWSVAGDITIHNPNVVSAIIDSVTDVVSEDNNMSVECDVDFPYILEPEKDLVCSYSGVLPDGLDRDNTATVIVTDDSAVPGDSATVPVLFGDPENIYDECVDVSDTMHGFLGTVCADQAPKTFEYMHAVGNEPECGLYEYPNIASFMSNDTQAVGTDDWTVYLDIPCNFGCTLTQGYWKTHSDYGPAPYDETWSLLTPDEEESAFFNSGQSWYEVLWTAPKKGNAYYILAHQYIAASLNILNEASAPDAVMDAIMDAEDLFTNHTPDEVEGFKGKSGGEIRDEFISLASTLGSYNEGMIGPGHCDGDSMYLLN